MNMYCCCSELGSQQFLNIDSIQAKTGQGLYCDKFKYKKCLPHLNKNKVSTQDLKGIATGYSFICLKGTVAREKFSN